MLEMHLNTILCSAVIYIFLIVAIRLFGKNELAQLSVTDLVFVLLISNAVQNSMVGSDDTLLGGILAASTLFVINKIFKMFIYKSDKFSKLMEGEPVILIRHGKVNEKELKKRMLSIKELEEASREQGIGDINTIDLAIMETDGKISILEDKNIKKNGPFDVSAEEMEKSSSE